jgi:hypothetical protein
LLSRNAGGDPSDANSLPRIDHLPGWVDTRMATQAVMAVMAVREIAASSGASTYITGADMVIDGGIRAQV